MAATEQSATGWQRVLPEESPEYVGLVYALVLVWGLGDVLSTYFAYATIGTAAAESNPWMEILLAYHPVTVVVVKAAVVLYAGVVLLACQNSVEKVPWWRFWLSSVVLLGVVVVINNLVVGVLTLL
jgi:hypothetical protein